MTAGPQISKMSSSLAILFALLFLGAGQPSVKVAPMDAAGPRPVEQQTQASVIRDYLKAWQGLGMALRQNQAGLLDRCFIGAAREKLADTIHEQERLGISASYQDRSHAINVVFYSPEGLSLQLVDDVEYDVEVRNQDGVLGSQHVQTRYVAVLTPTESQWKVRVFQGAVP